jgi:uncharacterized RDD family membrane protein YckC
VNDGRLSTGADERVFGREAADDAGSRFGREPAEDDPEPPSGPVTYELASWGIRAGAYLIDALAIAVVPFIVGVAVLVVDGDSDDSRQLAQTLIYVVGIPIALLYAPLLLMRRGARNGQTLGKHALGIRVVREDGEQMTIGSGLMREVIGRQLVVAFTYGLYAVVDYLFPLWDARRQCLHDKVGQTRVVRVTRSSALDAAYFTPQPDDGAAAAAEREPQPVTPGLRPAPPRPAARPEDDRPVRDGWLPPRAAR